MRFCRNILLAVKVPECRSSLSHALLPMLISLFCLETYSSEKAVLVLSFVEGSRRFSSRGKTVHERPVLIGIDWEEDLLI